MAKLSYSVGVRLSADVHQSLKEAARAEGRSLSGLIAKICADWIKRQSVAGQPRSPPPSFSNIELGDDVPKEVREAVASLVTRLNEEVHQALQEAAMADGRSVSALIARICVEWVNNQPVVHVVQKRPPVAKSRAPPRKRGRKKDV